MEPLFSASPAEMGENPSLADVQLLADGELSWEGNKKDILNTDNKTLNDFLFSSEILRQVKEQSKAK